MPVPKYITAGVFPQKSLPEVKTGLVFYFYYIAIIKKANEIIDNPFNSMPL